MATTSATAMTGGTVYNLINKPHPSASSSNIQLNLYVKEDSVNTSTRETTLKLGLYVKITNSSSRISIGPWSDYGPQEYDGQYYYSFLDDNTNTDNIYDGAIPKITTQEHWLVSNVTKVVKHNDDGTASTTIPWAWLVYSTWAGIVFPFGGDGTYSIPEVAITSMSPKSYPVIYYMNDEANTNLGAESKFYNTTFYINSSIPTRTGYEFLEWNTRQDGNGTSYQPGDPYTANNPLFLYAIWRAKTAYTITYNANGGSGAPAAQTKYKDDTLTLSKTKPIKTGYNFIGWGTSASATTVAYQPGANYTANAAITLYAIWELKTYTITYDANGGDGGPTTQTKQHGIAITLSTDQPTLPGYKFWGWDTEKRSLTGGFSADWDYNPGDTFTSNSDTTLYAVWEKKNYTITYNANGGSGAPSAETKGHDIDVTLSTTTPTREGYNFLCWNTKQHGNGTAYRSGASYTNNQSVTLYAQWNLIQYTIRFMSNGGLFNTSDTSLDEYKDYDVPFYFSNILLPTRDGYTLKEWNTKSDGTGTSYSLDSVYTANAALRVYAIWDRITYTVVYDTNGGTGTFSNQTKYHGLNLTLYTTLPTRTDYEFIGWNTQQDGNGTSYSAGATYTGNAAMTLYAQWNLIVSKCGTPTYLTMQDNNDNTVTFSCKVGSDGIGNTATAVELLISFSSTVSSSVYDCIFTLDGSTSTTVSKTFSFKNMPLAAVKRYFGQECNGIIKCIARTVGNAGVSYASNFTNAARVNFVWHEAAKPPKIISPDVVKGDVCDPNASQYAIELEAVDASINTAITKYYIEIYDITLGNICSGRLFESAVNNKIYFYPEDTEMFAYGHTYCFYIKAIGQNGFDSQFSASGPLFIKPKLPVITPVVTCAGIVPSTQIYGTAEAFLNPGFGPVMKISLPAFDYSDVKIDHYNLSLFDTLTGNTILDLKYLYENEVYVTADMLNPCGISPTGINDLEIRVDAVSVLCENDRSDTAVYTVKYINQCAGAYVDVHEDSGNTVKKRAVAFVKVNGVWKLASKFFARENQTTSFLQSDITYEALVDENDNIVVDINDEPIYLF